MRKWNIHLLLLFIFLSLLNKSKLLYSFFLFLNFSHNHSYIIMAKSFAIKYFKCSVTIETIFYIKPFFLSIFFIKMNKRIRVFLKLFCFYPHFRYCRLGYMRKWVVWIFILWIRIKNINDLNYSFIRLLLHENYNNNYIYIFGFHLYKEIESIIYFIF